MTGVQVTHGRHEGDPLTGKQPVVAHPAQFGNGGNDLQWS
jgi:hypothetical protein